MSDWLNSIWVWLKTEPARVTQGVQALLGILVSLNVISLTTEQTGGILALAAGGFGLVLALSVRPFKWPAVTTVVQALIVLGTSFGLNLEPEVVSAIYAVTAALGAMIVRPLVTPETKLSPVPS